MTDHVWALRTDLAMDEVELHLARLEAMRAATVPATARRLEVLGLTEEHGRTSIWCSTRSDDLDLDGTWEQVPAGGWDEAWRARLEPVEVGPFLVTPPWRSTGADREIVIEPAQAFGTGHHETTTGCLRALCDLDLAGRSVLDVGTGTGILAIAAARLGADPVVACDVDPVAVCTARDNAELNGVAVTVVRGSVEDVDAHARKARARRTADGSRADGGRFDVVVANLSTRVLRDLATALVDRCGKWLIVSGVGLEHTEEAVHILEDCGLQPTIHRGREWSVLTGACP